MRVKRWALSAMLSAALLVTPVMEALPGADLGPLDARAAEECKLKLEICQEFNVGFYSWKTCWEVRFFCD